MTSVCFRLVVSTPKYFTIRRNHTARFYKLWTLSISVVWKLVWGDLVFHWLMKCFLWKIYWVFKFLGWVLKLIHILLFFIILILFHAISLFFVALTSFILASNQLNFCWALLLLLLLLLLFIWESFYYYFDLKSLSFSFLFFNILLRYFLLT